jgi:type II secretory pathway pseudopilin PulG
MTELLILLPVVAAVIVLAVFLLPLLLEWVAESRRQAAAAEYERQRLKAMTRQGQRNVHAIARDAQAAIAKLVGEAAWKRREDS